MWILILNDMRFPKIEMTEQVCRASSKQELEDFMERELVPQYQEEDGGKTWSKEFRKGGPLEWYNRSVWRNPFVEIGTRQAMVDDAIARANEHYSKFELLPTAEVLSAARV